jgi:two-component system, OmpR family, manganese sensing response regulator
MHILLVDDEAALTEPLQRVLQREGYGVDVATDGQQGESLALSGNYDLLILDWMLPGRSGVEICRRVRQQNPTTPVLVLTAKDTLDDRVEGLDAGADDYLVKPFELRELLARVRALLRRVEGRESPPERLSAAGLELDPQAQVACRNNRTIPLSEKETRLLALFLRYPGELLTHDQILEKIWEGDRPSSNVLAAQIRLLRRKIEQTGEQPLIHTVYGKGYCFGLEA